MRIVHPSAKAFAKAMESVWNIIDEGVFKITKQGMNLMAMDPSQISMIVFNMPKESFFEFDVENDISLGLDIDYLKRVLKRAKTTETVELSVEDNKLKLEFKTEKTSRKFLIPLLDLTEGISREPAVEYSDYIVIQSEAIKDILGDASIIANYIKFILTPDGLEAFARSESGVVEEKFEKDSDIVSEINVESGAASMYPIQYLNDILKATRKTDNVKIYLATNKPLKMEYTLEGAQIRYYLAPRLEDVE